MRGCPNIRTGRGEVGVTGQQAIQDVFEGNCVIPAADEGGLTLDNWVMPAGQRSRMQSGLSQRAGVSATADAVNRMVRLRSIALLALSLLFSGCATGPTYDEVVDRFPAIKEGEARLFVLRQKAYYGVGILSLVRVEVNGETIGWLPPRSFLFKDVPAGEFKIRYTASTDLMPFLEDWATMTIMPGQTLTFDTFLPPNLYHLPGHSAIGRHDGLRYVGPPLALGPAR